MGHPPDHSQSPAIDGDIEARRDPRKHESPCDPLDSLLQASDTAIV